MKKIVILTDQISHIGGITSLIHIKANYWVTQKNYEVDIITTEQKKLLPYYKVNSKINIHDLSIDYDRTISYFNKKNLFNIIKNWFRLQKKLINIKPDIVIVANHIPVTFFFPLLITSAKFIKEFHFSKYYISKRKKTIFSKFENFIESKFDFLVVLSPEERAFYKHKNSVTIPNPILINSQTEPNNENRTKVAIAAGRISEVKRFDVLIDIWSEFAKKNRDWKLEIYGDGDSSYIEILKKKIKLNNMMEFIEIKDSTNNIGSIMRTRSLYLMTSSAECFPMVLLEAQTHGLPIISFDCPTGPRNIITNNINGVLVEMDNNTEFVEKLLELTSNRSKRFFLAKNGIKNSFNFTLDKVMEIWDDKIFNQIK